MHLAELPPKITLILTWGKHVTSRRERSRRTAIRGTLASRSTPIAACSQPTPTRTFGFENIPTAAATLRCESERSSSIARVAHLEHLVLVPPSRFSALHALFRPGSSPSHLACWGRGYHVPEPILDSLTNNRSTTNAGAVGVYGVGVTAVSSASSFDRWLDALATIDAGKVATTRQLRHRAAQCDALIATRFQLS